MDPQLSEEVRYRLLKYLAERPDATQRELAAELGVSVGKVNYCLKALIQCGWLKILNFRRSNQKSAYAYVLTPTGIQEKINVTYAFLRYKVAEYDSIAKEIDRLAVEVESLEQDLPTST